MTSADVHAVAALVDVLGLDPEPDGPAPDGADEGRLDAVVAAWAEAARDALGAGDLQRLRLLLHAADSAGMRSRPAAALLAEAAASMVDGPTVRRAIDEVRAAGRPMADLEVLLTRLGRSAVEAVLDALAAEEDRLERAELLGIASDLAPGHIDAVVGRLDDRRWYLVRNALTILGRTGRAPLSPVAALVDHEHPAVRREVGRVLISGGSAAVPALRRLGADPDPLVRVTAIVGLRGVGGTAALEALVELAAAGGPAEVRRHALDGLADVAGPVATEALRALASASGPRGMPWRLRRHARRLLRRREPSGDDVG